MLNIVINTSACAQAQESIYNTREHQSIASKIWLLLPGRAQIHSVARQKTAGRIDVRRCRNGVSTLVFFFRFLTHTAHRDMTLKCALLWVFFLFSKVFVCFFCSMRACHV